LKNLHEFSQKVARYENLYALDEWLNFDECIRFHRLLMHIVSMFQYSSQLSYPINDIFIKLFVTTAFYLDDACRVHPKAIGAFKQVTSNSMITYRIDLIAVYYYKQE
jgi:hypothetical protein